MPVVMREGLPGEVRSQRDRHHSFWSRTANLKRFLADHYPVEWQEVRMCRTAHKFYEWKDHANRFKAVPFSCHRLPFCVACVYYEQYRRVRKALDRFSMCTPENEEPRFIHIVQTAPYLETPNGPVGWGVEASQNVGRFAQVVWRSLLEFYGPGIGAYLSYQDFGNEPFLKRHPHIDLTLNGWRLNECNEPEKVPGNLVQGKGRKKWDEIVRRNAAALVRIDARRGNVDFTRPKEGVGLYYNILKYQLRELVDLKNIDYRRRTRTVEWWDYHHHRWVKIPAHRFVYGIKEYQERLGYWGKGQSPNLHRVFGHMAKRCVPKTMALMGGSKISHGASCPCHECGDWERVFLPEVNRDVGMGRPLMAEDHA